MKAQMEVVRERTGKLVCRYGFNNVLSGTASLRIAAWTVAYSNFVELIIGSDIYTLSKPQSVNHLENVNALERTVMELVRRHWGARIR